MVDTITLRTMCRQTPNLLLFFRSYMSEKIIYINYVDDISLPKVKGLMGVCNDLVAQHKPDKLYFLLASPGGDVNAGIAFYNFLKAIPVKVVMHNIGTIDSIATVIFTAGDERYANPHTSFLFHGAGMGINQGSVFSLGQLREQVSRLSKDQDKISGIICENTKLNKNEINNLFIEGESKDTFFAKDKGIINDIRMANIPPDSIYITVNFQ